LDPEPDSIPSEVAAIEPTVEPVAEAAAAPVVSVSDVFFISDEPVITSGSVADSSEPDDQDDQGEQVPGASSTLERSVDQATMSLQTSDLEPGIYTIWWMIYPPSSGATWLAAGEEVGQDGLGNFEATLKTEDHALVDDLLNTEVEIIMRYHGPPIEGRIEEQKTEMNGGCDIDPDPCENVQIAVHPGAEEVEPDSGQSQDISQSAEELDTDNTEIEDVALEPTASAKEAESDSGHSQDFTQEIPIFAFGTAEEVEGASAKLTKSDDGFDLVINTAGLTPDHAITVWWAVYHNPEECSDGVCDQDDEDIVSYGFAGGQVIDESGTADIEAQRSKYTVRDGAEIQFMVRDHGLVIPDMVDLQTSTPGGGCSNFEPNRGPNECEDVQIGVFAAQS
jgi:hypothetical protein